MEGTRRQYSEEFKKDAVGHSLTSEKTVEEVAQDLGIADELGYISFDKEGSELLFTHLS